jgi:adenylate cyclase
MIQRRASIRSRLSSGSRSSRSMSIMSSSQSSTTVARAPAGRLRQTRLFVIARNSSFAYKGQFPDIRQVGRELGVRYVLERAQGGSPRPHHWPALVEAETGRHIWAERYDRAMDDVFALQDEMTMNVVAAIEPSLREAEIERVKRKRPEHLDAYDLVLRAWPAALTGMPEGALAALPLLERALALEPDYALAHGYSAWCHENLFVRADNPKKTGRRRSATPTLP